MIFGWVLDAVNALLSPLVAALPPAGDVGSSTGLGGWLGAADRVVAIQGPLTLIAVLLLAVPVMLGLRFAVWVYRLIPAKFT